jgi:alcohol dehydrogenase class IV
MLVENRPVAYFLEGIGIATPTGRKVPFVAVPTTSGTGSEATNNAVISSIGETGFKKSLRHDNYIPDIALIDPTLITSCPRALTVACGMDTFTQLVEAYLSTSGSPFTDTLSIAGIQCVLRSLETTCNDGHNLAARADMAYASYLSGIVLANAGLGTIHGFASAIGGFFAIPHGVVCGTLMAESNRAALMRLRHTGENPAALDKYANLGRMVGGEPVSDEQAQDLFITYLDALTDKLGVARLGNYGIGENDLDKIVAHSANKDNPARFNESELHEILQARLAF